MRPLETITTMDHQYSSGIFQDEFQLCILNVYWFPAVLNNDTGWELLQLWQILTATLSGETPLFIVLLWDQQCWWNTKYVWPFFNLSATLCLRTLQWHVYQHQMLLYRVWRNTTGNSRCLDFFFIFWWYWKNNKSLGTGIGKIWYRSWFLSPKFWNLDDL